MSDAHLAWCTPRFLHKPSFEIDLLGATAAESGTYTDFCNINVGGLTADGSHGVNEVSPLLARAARSFHQVELWLYFAMP